MPELNPSAPYYQAFVIVCALISGGVAALLGASEGASVTTGILGAFLAGFIGLYVAEWFRSKHL
jgi:fructose-specific phosphotransferase system IIC component